VHHTYINKDLIKYAATLLNYPRQCSLTILTKLTLARSNRELPDDGDYTETCWSCFNVNFNVYFNLQEPRVLYIGQAYRYPPDVAFYIFFFNNYKY